MDFHIALIAVCFMGLDIITGFIQAVKNGDVSSAKMRDGLFHKCGFIGAIALAYLCEFSMAFIDLGFTVPLAVPVCAFIIWLEVVSNLENLGRISPELSNNDFMKLFNHNE